MTDILIHICVILGGILLILVRNRMAFGGDNGVIARNPDRPSRGAAIVSVVAGILLIMVGVVSIWISLK